MSVANQLVEAWQAHNNRLKDLAASAAVATPRRFQSHQLPVRIPSTLGAGHGVRADGVPRLDQQ